MSITNFESEKQSAAFIRFNPSDDDSSSESIGSRSFSGDNSDDQTKELELLIEDSTQVQTKKNTSGFPPDITALTPRLNCELTPNSVPLTPKIKSPNPKRQSIFPPKDHELERIKHLSQTLGKRLDYFEMMHERTKILSPPKFNHKTPMSPSMIASIVSDNHQSTLHTFYTTSRSKFG